MEQAPTPSTALSTYVLKKDSTFRWHIQEQRETEAGTYYYVHLVSQQWQGIIWQHQLAVFFPHQASLPKTLLLVLRHLEQKEADLNGLKVIAQETGSPCAMLYGMPNQPLFEGKEEEELINFSFNKYLKTGEETWPLLLPMVKSVVRAMDALQALSKEEKKPLIEGFMVTGHSKRAHTSWLSAAVDQRVKGIMPVAFDLLNSPAQIKHHYEVFGELSNSAQAGKAVLAQIQTPRGQNLIRIVDAYAYRSLLTLPKLIVIGTNDDYSPSDALNLYWEGLPGPKWILYLPNTDHVGAYFAPAVNATAFAFMRAVASGKPLPTLHWQFAEEEGWVSLSIQTDTSANKATLWSTSAATQDFRTAQWSAQAMEPSINQSKSEKQFEIKVKKPTAGFIITFAELEYELNGKKFALTTQVRVEAGKK